MESVIELGLPEELVYVARARKTADATPRVEDAPQAAVAFQSAVASLAEARH
jgi:hypothetical protein